MRNGLSLGGRRCLHQVYHGFDSNALGSIEEKTATLGLVATHLQKFLERRLLERTNEMRDAALQPGCFDTVGAAQLLSDLEEVADDNLVISLFTLVLVDCARHRR